MSAIGLHRLGLIGAAFVLQTTLLRAALPGPDEAPARPQLVPQLLDAEPGVGGLKVVEGLIDGAAVDRDLGGAAPEGAELGGDPDGDGQESPLRQCCRRRTARPGGSIRSR